MDFETLLLGPPTRNPKDDWKFPANYLRIGTFPESNGNELREHVLRFTEEIWTEEVLRTYLSEYLNAVILLHHERRHRLWHELELERVLAPLFDLLRDFYGGGEPVLVSLDRLKAATTIPAHRDGPVIRPPWPDTPPPFFRRTHIPLITNDQVEFVIGGERRHLGYCEVWEINNWRVHHVENRGTTDRVHLLVDWNRETGRAPTLS